MKKRIFSSGEEILKKNVRTLEEGMFLAKHLEYDDINEDTEFIAVGEIDEKPATVNFTVQKDELGDLKFKFGVNIIMQSDIWLSKWEKYKLTYL